MVNILLFLSPFHLLQPNLYLPLSFPVAKATKSSSFKDKMASGLPAPLPRTTLPSFLQSIVKISSLPSLFLMANWKMPLTYFSHVGEYTYLPIPKNNSNKTRLTYLLDQFSLFLRRKVFKSLV